MIEGADKVSLPGGWFCESQLTPPRRQAAKKNATLRATCAPISACSVLAFTSNSARSRQGTTARSRNRAVVADAQSRGEEECGACGAQQASPLMWYHEGDRSRAAFQQFADPSNRQLRGEHRPTSQSVWFPWGRLHPQQSASPVLLVALSQPGRIVSSAEVWR
jgi:hypothetical protein